MDEKLRMTAPAGFIYFALDHLGSAGALLDSAGGIVERLHYEPFGGSTGSTLTRYGYTGRENDAATGLMYYRTRWYDPQQSRFVTEDSTRFGDGMNLYAYVQNNPVVFIDPWGRAKVYYWGPRLSPFRVGHLSIQLEDGTYISFWPGEAPSGIAFGKKFQATTHDTYGQDAEAEGGDADGKYQVDGLDEAAIKDWWEKEKQNPPKYWGGHACADEVSDALLKGGLDPLSQCPPGHVCSPRNIVNGMLEEAKRSQKTGFWRFWEPTSRRTTRRITVTKAN